ncbi:MAG: hypothetical protein D6765_16520, partial [Bacteroidetes bacterium]
FQLGKMHRKVDPAIEFAVISNDYAFDSLIAHINAEGRSCLRVKHQPETPAPPSETRNRTPETRNPAARSLFNGQAGAPFSGGQEEGKNTPTPLDPIDEVVENTLKRLIESGNRPIDLELLKEYIVTHNRQPWVAAQVDEIVRRLASSQEIKILDSEVVYHF